MEESAEKKRIVDDLELIRDNNLEDLIKDESFNEILIRLSHIFDSYDVEIYYLPQINEFISLLISKTDDFLVQHPETEISPTIGYSVETLIKGPPNINLLILQCSWVIQLIDGILVFDNEEIVSDRHVSYLTPTLKIAHDLTIKFYKPHKDLIINIITNNSTLTDDYIEIFFQSKSKLNVSLDKFVKKLGVISEYFLYPNNDTNARRETNTQQEMIDIISKEEFEHDREIKLLTDPELKKMLLDAKKLNLPRELIENIIFGYLDLAKDPPKKHDMGDLGNSDSDFDFSKYNGTRGSVVRFGKKKRKTRVNHKKVVKTEKTKKVGGANSTRKTRHIKKRRARYSKTQPKRHYGDTP